MIDNYYKKLFLECQKNKQGLYKMFVFDIKDSKKMSLESRITAQHQIIFLIERMYFDLKYLEESLNYKILLDDLKYGNIFDSIKNNFAFLYDPFLLGDCVGLTIYNNSVSDEIIYYLFSKNKTELNIEFPFHINSGIYETDDWNLGNILCFRGYCLKILSNLQKEENKKLLKDLDKIKNCESQNIEEYIQIIENNHSKALNEADNYLRKKGIEFNLEKKLVKK